MQTRLSALCLFLAWRACGADFYVDIDSRGGPCDDAGPGTLQRPWCTLSRIAAEQDPRPQSGDIIWVRGGVYKEQVNLHTGGTADVHGGQAYVFENASRSATQWVKHDLPTWSKQGSHNLWVADINADGMPDIMGNHYERGSSLEVWYNTLVKPALPGK